MDFFGAENTETIMGWPGLGEVGLVLKKELDSRVKGCATEQETCSGQAGHKFQRQ